MAASLISRAAAAAALRGAARPSHLLARASLPKGRVGWAAEGAGAGASRCGPSPLLVAFGIAARCNATSSSSVVSEAAGVHAIPRTEPVVSAEWLHANLKDPDVKVLDASWYMPAEQRNPLQEYQVAHIPGALFFDVDGISDRTSSLPHMLPSEKAFSAAVSALGIDNNDGIVVYDGKGLFSAARVWWMFRVFGHDKVWVLDGGLPQWRASGYDVESSASSDAILKASAAGEAIEKVYLGQWVGPPTFEAKLQSHLLWSLDQVKENINTQTHQLIDARSKPRFDGAVPEPRKGIRSGHVPGSKCVPFPQVDTLLDSVKWDSKGLAVAIAQNVDTGAILMQGFANKEALAKTISTRKATFFSRSRSSLWTKGETSMNFINVHDIFLDCDRDSIIYLGKPDGPTCHTGAETCYYTSVYDALKISEPNEGRQVMTTLYSLEDTISRRQEEIVTEGGAKPSWTKKLLLDNQLLCSKIREEAGELIQTLLENEDQSRAASEMADLLYHAMVLLRVKDVKMEEVLEVLRKRFSQSGIEEKAGRKKS